MKIKAADIARGLGISKATVSLALNNKPGVSEEKRREIFAYKERLERGEIVPRTASEIRLSSAAEPQSEQPNVIMVVMASKEKQIAINSEIDLWSDVLSAYQRTAKRAGYETQVMYVDVLRDDAEDVVAECNSPKVAGVLLAAAELDDEDLLRYESINKPLVLYDNETADPRIYCVMPDNRGGVAKAVRYLLERGKRDVVYLANSGDILNFRQRREGFLLEMTKNRIDMYAPERIVTIGGTINEADENLTAYLKSHPLPQAFIMENYQVTVGAARALRRMGVRVPEDVSLIGIDKLPSYMTGDVNITSVRIMHSERAELSMQSLLEMVKSSATGETMSGCMLIVHCLLEEGDSVQ